LTFPVGWDRSGEWPGEFENGWGSCGTGGNIRINRHWIFAPRQVLEYVVAHELAHLRHRSHGPQFWDFPKFILPKCERSNRWLQIHQATLSDQFLSWDG
jgi:hypothetical protein